MYFVIKITLFSYLVDLYHSFIQSRVDDPPNNLSWCILLAWHLISIKTLDSNLYNFLIQCSSNI